MLLTLNESLQHVPEGFHHEKRPVGVAIATDIEDGKPVAYDLPAPSKAGALAATSVVKDKDGKPVNTGVNGVLDQDEKERWVARTGWAPRFGNGDPKDDEGPSLLDHETWLEGKLDDSFFGGKSHSSQVWSLRLTLLLQIGITIRELSSSLASHHGLLQSLGVVWRGSSSLWLSVEHTIELHSDVFGETSVTI